MTKLHNPTLLYRDNTLLPKGTTAKNDVGVENRGDWGHFKEVEWSSSFYVRVTH